MQQQNTPNCVCVRCGTRFYRLEQHNRKTKKHYCSSECFRVRAEFVCGVCGKIFSRPASSVIYHINKTCSLKCKYEAAKTKLNHIESIVKRIDRTGGPNACWPYHGAHLPRGYGTYKNETGSYYAHRVAYEIKHGPIAENMEIHHTCGKPQCCNPAHLEMLTRDEHQRIHFVQRGS